MNTEERKRLRKLCDKATPGPWTEEPLNALLRFGRKQDGPWCDHDGVCPDDADAEFIAAARTAVPALLDALDEAEAELAGYEVRQAEAVTGAEEANRELTALRERVEVLEKVREAAEVYLTAEQREVPENASMDQINKHWDEVEQYASALRSALAACLEGE